MTGTSDETPGEQPVTEPEGATGPTGTPPSRRTRALLAGGAVVAVAAAALAFAVSGGDDGDDTPSASPTGTATSSAEAGATDTLDTLDTLDSLTDPATSGTRTEPAPDPTDDEDAPVVEPALAPTEPTEAVELYVRSVDLALAAGSDDPAPAELVVAEPLLSELTVQLEEYTLNGWHQEGRTTVVGAEVVEDGDSERVLRVCLDSSDVLVVDEAGTPVQSREGLPTRSAVLVTVVEEDGAWWVSERTFPEDPDC